VGHIDTQEGYLGLFRFLGPKNGEKPLILAQAAIENRIGSLETAFAEMRLQWEVVTAQVDNQTSKVHRELGHVTRRRKEIEDAEGGCPDEVSDIPQRRTAFSGGRGRA